MHYIYYTLHIDNITSDMDCLPIAYTYSQACMGSVLARIIEIDIDQGFAFNSCNTCYGAATRDGSKFYCGHCDCLVTASPRFAF